MTERTSFAATSLPLRLFTIVVALATLFLIFAGAMVTSTGSGLAVPDWPLSYGMIFPPMVGGIFYEHGHRMIATLVGFLTVIQAVWLQRSSPLPLVRRLGWISLGAVVVQGVLGGITVLLLLPVAVSVAHAALAQIFLALNVAIAFLSSRTVASLRASGVSGSLRGFATVLFVAIFVQIVIGAVMRHLGAGMVIPDFPLSLGQVIPPLVNGAIMVNFAHRALGILLALAIVAAAPLALRRSQPMRPLYFVMVLAVVCQIALAALTVWYARAPVVTSLHVVTGAFIFALSTMFLVGTRLVEPAPAPQPALTEVMA